MKEDDQIRLIEVMHKGTNTRIAFKYKNLPPITCDGKPMTIKEVVDKYGKGDWILCDDVTINTVKK
jgi:hypothetical protein